MSVLNSNMSAELMECKNVCVTDEKLFAKKLRKFSSGYIIIVHFEKKYSF